MQMQFVPVRNQKFEIGRTINPFKCDCDSCDFLHCPKDNYAVKMQRKKYKLEDFWDTYKDDILAINKPLRWQYKVHEEYELKLSYFLIDEFIDALFSFPKGTYWSPNSPKSYDGEIENRLYSEITLQKLNRKYEPVDIATIYIKNGRIWEYDLSERQYKLADKIRDALKELKKKVFEYYEEQDKDWKIGWLSPDGRHYPCSHCEHSILSRHLGGGEALLESTGWVKVALEEEYGYFCNHHMLTAEQRNWLSLNGYLLED